MILQMPKTVKFDPSNKAHRASVRAFMKRRAWGDAPIRFSHDPVYGSVPEQVQTKLLAWYLEKEVAPKKQSVMVANPKVSQLKKKVS
jgi:hypothetical protein